MEFDERLLNERLEHIEVLLERIACAVEAKAKPKGKTYSDFDMDYNHKHYTSPSAYCIAVYYDSFIARYKAKPVLTGIDVSAVKRILKSVKPDYLATIIQVYLQMNDPWLITRRHDLATLESNMNKVAIAMQHGHEQTDINWGRVFKEGTTNDTGSISGPDSEAQAQLQRTQLQGGACLPLLEGATDRE